jgi:mRNA interferase RelE/StbE
MTTGAARQFDKLPVRAQARLAGAFRRLADWPKASGVKALAGNLKGWYRIRVGDYRMRFFVSGNAVVIDKIAHRKDIYEN